jgi:hypothetical protein
LEGAGLDVTGRARLVRWPRRLLAAAALALPAIGGGQAFASSPSPGLLPAIPGVHLAVGTPHAAGAAPVSVSVHVPVAPQVSVSLGVSVGAGSGGVLPPVSASVDVGIVPAGLIAPAAGSAPPGASRPAGADPVAATATTTPGSSLSGYVERDSWTGPDAPPASAAPAPLTTCANPLLGQLFIRCQAAPGTSGLASTGTPLIPAGLLGVPLIALGLALYRRSRKAAR